MDGGFMDAVFEPSSKGECQDRGHPVTTETAQSSEFSLRKDVASFDQGNLVSLSRVGNKRGLSSDVQESSLSNTIEDEPLRPRPGDWARVLEAATQRRTEVLTPENLENMWAIGRNYKKKLQKKAATGIQAPVNSSMSAKDVAKEVPIPKPQTSNQIQDKSLMQLIPKAHPNNELSDHCMNTLHLSQNMNKEVSLRQASLTNDCGKLTIDVVNENVSRLKRSSSTSDLIVQPAMKSGYADEGGRIITEYYSADSSRYNEFHSVENASDRMLQSEAFHAPKLKCRVVGAYFEKLGSKSFAVYSIAVTDANNKTWFVKRRYRNFERLHRQLKDIPNYTLHLPPKRIFSSSTEDAFVHQRCIQLDKYLQDLLSIPNVAEQHEVWDFLSASSKNYSFGKSSSVMRTLAVNVDDAMDDIVRQFKGVSDGLMRKVVGSPSSPLEPASSVPPRLLSWNVDEMNKLALTQSVSESVNSFSDYEDGYKDGSQGQEEAESGGQANGWHSDNELNSKSFPPRVVKRDEEFGNLDSEKKHDSGDPSKSQNPSKTPESSSFVISDCMDDPIGVPPEWTPPKLSLPVLNLVDNLFQLKKRGWLRRQVFWISKQILQLMMEDAIDDWLLRQIHWLRRDDVVAYGIQWIQNALWPDGTFFLKLSALSGMDNHQSNQGSTQTTETPTRSKVPRPASFEQQLEASRRANDVKKMLYDGAPTALVGLIGHKQYRRCARDLYYFLQSTICLKQLAYGILELVLISIFPELRDLVVDIHRKRPTEHV